MVVLKKFFACWATSLTWSSSIWLWIENDMMNFILVIADMMAFYHVLALADHSLSVHSISFLSWIGFLFLVSNLNLNNYFPGLFMSDMKYWAFFPSLLWVALKENFLLCNLMFIYNIIKLSYNKDDNSWGIYCTFSYLKRLSRHASRLF